METFVCAFWVLLAGDAETGVTWHEMVADADAGSILRQERFSVAPDDTLASLGFKAHSAAVVK